MESHDALRVRAGEFAAELGSTLRAVLAGDMPEFVVETSPGAAARPETDRTRILVRPHGGRTVPLQVDGRPTMDLVCEFHCIWDHREAYLKVTSSKLHVIHPASSVPLFRYEFTENPGAHNPVAHLHVHAHRDEILYALMRAEKRRSRKRARAARGETRSSAPKLADLHFPLGGARLRPCLEDVLEMLRVEFEIDVKSGAEAALRYGRARWRRRQVSAAVRDAPAEAARVLCSLGYAIQPPVGGEPAERTDHLERY